MPALASREGIKTRTMHIPVAARAALAAAAARGVAAAHDVRCPARVRCAVLSALRHSSPHPEQRVMSQQRAQRAPGPARRRRGRPQPTSSWPVAASTREARARLDEARRRTIGAVVGVWGDNGSILATIALPTATMLEKLTQRFFAYAASAPAVWPYFTFMVYASPSSFAFSALWTRA